MILRPYQEEALQAVKKDLDKLGASLCILPTASGKSHIIAAIATLAQPVLILVPSMELLSQNLEKLALIVSKDQIGIYSASFKSKEIKRFTFATIQSVYKKPELFGHVKLVIIDECNQVQLRSIGGMYAKFLASMGSPKILGLTASPFRNEIGYFRHPNGDLEAITMLKLLPRMRHKSQKDMFWKRILYHIPHKELLKQGYLCPLKYIHEPLLPYQEIPINQSRSDYNLEAYSQAIVGREALILSTISEAQRKYKSILVFCATTTQAQTLSQTIIGSACVFGNTDKKERLRIIKGFKDGSIKTVFNVNCLTVGFDHPALDCIVLLRPTRSLVLYQQMLGRLVRIAEGKTIGTVIDLTGTCKAFGPVESIELYQNTRGLWDVRTDKFETFHDRVLYSRIIK